MTEFEETEYKYLSETLGVIRKRLKENETKALFNIGEITQFNKFIWENKKSGMDKQEVVSNITEAETCSDITNNTLRQIRSLNRALDSPYFGRISFTSSDGKKRELYIGLSSVMEGNSFYVLDWRSPVSSLFYNAPIGEASYKAPVGLVKVYLDGKRQYKIKDGKLKRVIESNIHIADDSLQEVLSRNSTDKMRSIVDTIQREQSEIIRNISDKNLVVQGGAGSGKTAVALHRLAYLLYQDRKTFSNNMLIFSPNEIFSSYISNVLPELGEENVLQTTFSDFASAFFAKKFKHLETFTEFLSRSYDGKCSEEEEELNKFKFSAEYKDTLDKYISSLKASFKFSRDVEIKNFVLDKDVISKRLNSYEDNISINEKVEELSHEICTALRIPYDDYGATVVNKLKRALHPSINCRKFYNDFLSSSYFVDAFGKSDELEKNSSLSYPDLLGMLYLNFELLGYPRNDTIRHLVIDEVQDYSPLQLKMIRKLFGGSTFTVLGDVNQTINPYHHYNSLEDIGSLLGYGSKYFELNKSYRSSPEIMDYSNGILGIDNMESIRKSDSVPVVCKEVDKDSLHTELVKDILTMRENGLERIAVVTKSSKDAKAIFEGLKDDIEDISVICDDEEYSNSQTLVTPSYIAKGLEFDAVISYNNSQNPYSEKDKYLYYVACTRAQHNLVVYNEPKNIKSKKM